MNHPVTYHFFWNGPFSQWQTCHMELDGVIFNTAEQAMMYLKAMLFDDKTVAQEILDATDPGQQKALGRKVRGFSEAQWDLHKEEIVYRINRAKYHQNKGLRRKLFQTIPHMMIEASPVDSIWGIGLDAKNAALTDPELWPGQNLLGQILTQVRTELADEFPDEAAACSSEGQETLND
ncbi:N-glycosidase YbiA [Aliiroseovarius sp. xm-m-379]|uniref:NADAR family protein n=1 Tax=unclassified Aliiroseovarius TaxID=2623558 RepID=UPI001567D64E|nr:MULTISPECIES: NADAR family protein [unclassified Aliiroseovarius]NRP11357.1 N-glycosidase YbiA [Aliiroseovarius sp. xm-d-517]NRP23852.1 N-glycosidase YbiA [Aliiroseovarius sp. xm-m-379]NRP28901.1 N-glycosidase YbiA [Aliiroseovarius sp. xm-m-314]NRP32651.1 N-glycosidase YbiA [Aliiroseovarius sp. xm-a-104]NRP42604.1 N-glycosidase YbiA [Aliiroseovarius sp. xm-m-339-2]